MNKHNAVAVILAAALFALAGCGGGGHSAATTPPPAPTTPISKYTVSGSSPTATITASTSNPYTNQVSVASFSPTTKVDLVTIVKTSTPPAGQTFSESVSTSTTAQYPTYQAPVALERRPPALSTAQNPLAGEDLVRSRERRLLASVSRPAARSSFLALQQAFVAAPSAYVAGDPATFNVFNFNTNANQLVNAHCQYVSSNAYVFVDDSIGQSTGANYNAIYDQNSQTLQAISAAFDGIYTADRATFGSEWTPGIDNDPKILILISPAVNSNGNNGILGYFNSGDEYPTSSVALSNQHEMFYVVSRMQGDSTDIWADATTTKIKANQGYAILAHEFQHMINFNTKYGHNGAYDGVQEDTWLNEGLSMYAMQVCGYGMPQGDATTAGHVKNYLNYPETFSLTNWTSANYGMSYLFVLYLVEQYGGGVGTVPSQTMLQAMESNALVGIANVESQTGGTGTFGTVFKNWAMANLLDKTTNDAAYNYVTIDLHASYGSCPNIDPTICVALTGIWPFGPFSSYPLTSPYTQWTQFGWSALYQEFTGGTNDALNFSLTNSNTANNLEAMVIVQ